MIEAKGDIWKYPCHWIAIPTNGIFVIKDGLPAAVMGAGVAAQAVQKVYDVIWVLGEKLQKQGNKVYHIGDFTRDDYVPKVNPKKQYQLDQVVVSLFSFPTKHHYKDPSDLQLIEKSCQELYSQYNSVVLYNKSSPSWKQLRIPIVVLPRCGTGLGRLNWEKDVRPVFQKYFVDDNFVILS